MLNVKGQLNVQGSTVKKSLKNYNKVNINLESVNGNSIIESSEFNKMRNEGDLPAINKM